jgi:hypothetical protein
MSNMTSLGWTVNPSECVDRDRSNVGPRFVFSAGRSRPPPALHDGWRRGGGGQWPAAGRSRRLHYFSTTRVEFSRLWLTREDSKRDGKRLSIQGFDHNLRIVN